MAVIERFEDIEAWKKARELTAATYAASSAGGFARDFGLRDQIRRASVSIMSNIAEGFERDGNQEFRQFLAIAKGSSGEVKSQLYVALDAHFVTPGEFARLYGLADESARLIRGFITYLKSSDLRGSKFNRA
jgi:four helix bundle protein